MKFVAVIALVFVNASAFSGAFAGTKLGDAVSNSGTLKMEYIPSGMSKDQWRKIKEAEKKKSQGKDFGKVGITTFKSRSFMDWQKSGGKNLFPVDPTKVKDPKQIPYMQRAGGAPDDSDLKKPNPFGSLFKKKEIKEEPEPVKQTNWWTL